MGVQRTQVTMLLKPIEALEKNADVFMGSHVTGLKNSRSPLSPLLLLHILHMRKLGHLVPLDRVAGAVGAEHRIGRILQVRLRIIV